MDDAKQQRKTVKTFLVKISTWFLGILYSLFTLQKPANRIVFISRQSNSPSADFLLIQKYLKEHYPDLETVLLCKALDNPFTYLFHMLKQIYYLATSRAIVLDSYCIVVSLLCKKIKAPVIQIWHALGNMKKFGYAALDEPDGRSSKTARLFNMHRGYDSILISSKSFIKDFAAGFDVDESLITEIPLPRVDLFTDKIYANKERKKILAKYPCLGTKKNIVYCPTFRRTKSLNEDEAIKKLIEAIDFDIYNFVFSPHPVSTQSIDDPRVLTVRKKKLNMLYVADYVISDYSTVIYEAGLLRLPIYLYAYDWKEYSSRLSLNIDIEHDVPTLFTDNPKKILEAIYNNQFDFDAYSRFIEHNIALPASKTCTQLVSEHIVSIMEKQEKTKD